MAANCPCDSLFVGRFGHSLQVSKVMNVAPEVAAIAAADYPIISSVLEFPCCFKDSNGISTIENFRVIESNTSDGALQKKGGKLLLFSAMPTTLPVAATLYEMSATDYAVDEPTYLGCIDYQGVLKTAAALYTAKGYDKPTTKIAEWHYAISSFLMKNPGTETTLYGVLLSTEAVDYDSNSKISILLGLRYHR